MLDTWIDSPVAWGDVAAAWLTLESPESAAPVGALPLVPAVRLALGEPTVTASVPDAGLRAVLLTAPAEAVVWGTCLAASILWGAILPAVATVSVTATALAVPLDAATRACLAGTGVREVRLLASPCATRVVRASPLSGRAVALASFLTTAVCLASPVEIEQT